MSFLTDSSGFGNWGKNLDSSGFPDPFTDYASLAMPETNPLALRVCEFAFLMNGTYREASRRILSYFITDLKTESDSEDVAEKWKEFLDEDLDIRNTLRIVGLDLSCYGNSFASLIPNFTRYLQCPKCKMLEVPLRSMMEENVFKFNWSNFQFCATCPKCQYSGAWRYYDRPAGDQRGFHIKRWNPHHIELLNDEWSGENRYIWKIPEDYRRQVKDGKWHVIEQAPKQVIEAVKNGNYLMFERDFIHHMREDALAGLSNRGWGISRVLTNFRQMWYVQVLHRYNEALAMDYIIPFRLITPVPGDKSTGSDLLLNANAGGYMAQIHAMLRRRRSNPIGWNTLPFPVQYQSVGGDAKALAPGELLTQGTETLLNCIGTPAELYRGNLSMQVMPAALRLFEASNSHISHNFNGFLRFIVRKAAAMLKWEPVKASLERVTHADDAAKQLNILQLAASGKISDTRALRVVGTEYKDEVRQQMADQKFMAEQQAELQEQMENSAQMQTLGQPQGGGAAGQPPPQGQAGGGQPQQGGDPNQAGAGAGTSIMANLPQGPNQKITPEEQLSRAQVMAQQLLGMPESQKDSELRKLKTINPNLHAIVRAQMDQIRQQMRMQGGSQMMSQAFPKQGSDANVIDAILLQKKASRLKSKLNHKAK